MCCVELEHRVELQHGVELKHWDPMIAKEISGPRWVSGGLSTSRTGGGVGERGDKRC